MNLRSFFFILFCFISQRSVAQEFKFLIQFKDKNNSGFHLSDPSSFLSIKSIQRKLKLHIGIDSTDLPVTLDYIDSLSALTSVKILNKSRWFNQVLISISDTAVLHQIRQFPFVLSSVSVNNHRLKKITDSISVNKYSGWNTSISSENLKTQSSNTLPINYGASASQIQIHHGDYLHILGFHGESMTIAILDNGFNNYLHNPAFDSLRNSQRILGSYDFVHQKKTVDEESIHGSNCFSIIAADMPGTLVGSAPKASYWLFKTEDDDSESPVEEQNWVAAAEFADSVGVDLITTSLGYSYFDDSVYDLTYSERNGHTALVSLAANMAVAKGMIVTASAGNSGFEPAEKKYVVCPADGDRVYAVGAVSAIGIIAGFSSWGPNGGGQVKPDGVSVGSGTSFIGPDGQLYTGGGTSYANPNLAGLITCLWQAFPEFGPTDILSAVRQSSNQYEYPDDRYGYGLPNFEKAYSTLLIKSLSARNPSAGHDQVYIFPVPFNKNFNVSIQPTETGTASLQLLAVSGKLIQTESFQVTARLPQLFEFKVMQPLTTGVYFIRYNAPHYGKTIKLLKN